jgi:hypothetical protein
MRKVLLVAAPLALALLTAVLIQSAFQERKDAAAAQAERLRLKNEFGERAALLRALPTDGTLWRDEVNVLLRAYLQSLAEVRNRYPKAPAPLTGLAAAEADRKGKLDEKARAMYEDFQRYADGRMALLTGGAYAPLASAVAGGLRLDVLSVEPGRSPEGGPELRLDFALWGAPRLLDVERTREGTVRRTVVPVAMKSLEFRFLDAAGKQYGGMSGQGEPDQKLADPERFVSDFPPGVLCGTWRVELLPREAVSMELHLEADVRAPSGGALPASFTIMLPVQEPWRIPPGASYQAEIREAPAVGP